MDIGELGYFDKRMDRMENKMDKLVETLYEHLKNQRIQCIKECDMRYVIKEMLEPEVHKILKEITKEKVDIWHKLTSTLKELVWLVPTLVLVLYYFIYIR